MNNDGIERMRITTILGSPRKNGNTARLLTAFEEIVSRNFEIARINVIEKGISGCVGCDACQNQADVSGCRQRDDFAETMDRIIESDAVVYATPVYVWDFPAQMKALMDRHYCLVKWKGRGPIRHLLAGKPAVLLATCGGAAGSNADLLRRVFRREMDYLRFRVIGTYVADGCTTPAALGARGRTIAENMAKDMGRFFKKAAAGRA